MELMESLVDSVIDSQRNFNNIILSIGKEEAHCLFETGHEIIYEEGKIKSFFKKIYEALKNAWKKIKSVFDKFINMLTDSLFGSEEYFTFEFKFNYQSQGPTITSDVVKASILEYADKAFIEDAYDVKLKKEGPTEICRNVQNKFNQIMRELKEMNSKSTKNYLSTTNADASSILRGAALGLNMPLSSDDFSKYLKKELGLDKPVAKLSYRGDIVVHEVLYGKQTAVDSARRAFSSTGKAFVQLEKDLKIAEKETSTDSDSVPWLSSCMVITSAAIAILQASQVSYVAAVNKFRSNCKQISLKCVNMYLASLNQ